MRRIIYVCPHTDMFYNIYFKMIYITVLYICMEKQINLNEQTKNIFLTAVVCE